MTLNYKYLTIVSIYNKVMSQFLLSEFPALSNVNKRSNFHVYGSQRINVILFLSYYNKTIKFCK